MKTIQTLEMIGISKSFQGVRANDNISLKVSSGEILGLLGENGAGKTTLMNILYGIYQPDSGEIRVNDRRVFIDSPKASIEYGIGMVHQHFMLIQNHTVIENIALGYAWAPGLFPQKKIRQNIVSFSEKFNFNIDPDKKVWQLSAGEQQRVEIIKALINGAGLLILDEPTSVLTPQETRDFFHILEQMRADGQMIILISHKLDEIKKLCDRVTVIRKGKVVGHADTDALDKRALARMMIGRDVVFSFSREKMPRKEKVLEVNGIKVDGDKGYAVVKGISFEVYKNEILGIAGVSGNGQRELVEAITGLRPSTHGQIRINGVDITNQ
ncbi:MAG: ATP-binding cassette domain-containing protein, partial [Desulfosarcina sp.]